ncbi:HDOD domain-containing protein [Massilia agilis]|uniref:HDOD domain-containing protein n=1 Tax=Massilia agilis TaxID=1811226 RepID=A0ABT2DAL4_9BURK|nr:HDOD domain-containing protein [Massilia agilis]MCS0808331.1 HDOD domain-containing protein [Massilia agilis]
MVALSAARFPLVELDFVANAQNEWVALIVRPQPGSNDESLLALFGAPDLLAAIAPLDCIVPLDSTAVLTSSLCELLPPDRVMFTLPASVLANADEAARAASLADAGYRLLVDGVAAGGKMPSRPRGVAHDCTDGGPAPAAALFGPHLAYNVHSVERFAECESAGFDWFSGDYPLFTRQPEDGHDGTSRRRLLALLALLSRDADTREIEHMLKQDPALSFHLLKLVNSAAFKVSTEITSFAQAITVLGRRQLQRWLQLLLYARQRADGPPNLLLPLAALRGAQLEELCRLGGGERDEQDLAFMCGAFSLLDRLFDTPMGDIVGSLRLPQHVLDGLLRREGPLGERLRLVEGKPDQAQLAQAGIDIDTWWRSQLHGWHWAIQVMRHV